MEPIMEQKVIELLEKANEKYYDEDYSGACDIYQQILKIEQKSCEPMIYMIFCLIRSLSIDDFVSQNSNEQIAKYQINIGSSLDNIKDRIGKDNKEYIESWLNIYRDFIDVIISCHSYAVSYYKKVVEAYQKGAEYVMRVGRDIPYQQLQQLRLQINELKKNCSIANNNYVIITKKLIHFNNNIVLHIIDNIENYSLISSAEVQELFDSVAKIYHLDEGENIHNEKIAETTKETLYAIQCAKTKAKDFEIKEYWKDKPERKKELEDIKEKYQNEHIEIQIKIKELEREVEQLEQNINKPFEVDEARKRQITYNQNELIKQKNSLGLFKGKEKVSLQSKIDEIQVEINQLDTKIKTEKAKLKDKYQPTIDEKNRKIKELERKLEQLKSKEEIINKELYLKED